MTQRPAQHQSPSAPSPTSAPPRAAGAPSLDSALRVAQAVHGQSATVRPNAPLLTALAEAASNGQRAANPAEAGLGKAFLTPRVIDQRAFEDFAPMLRDLSLLAERKAGELRDVLDLSDQAAKKGQESARQQRAAVEVLGKLLHALGARTAQVEDLLKQADDRGERARQVEEAAQEGAANVLKAFDAAIRQRVAKSVEAIEQAGAVQAARVEGVAAAAERRLEELQRRAATLAESAGAPGGIASIVADAERVKDEMTLACRRVAELREQAGKTMERLTDHLAAAALASDDLSSRQEAWTKRFEAARADAEPLLRAAERVEVSRSTLDAALEQAERARTHATQTGQQLASLLSRADDSREQLDRWSEVIRGAESVTDLPPALGAIAREFRTSLAQDLSKMASAMSLIARRAETTVRPGAEGSPEIVIRVNKDRDGAEPAHSEVKLQG